MEGLQNLDPANGTFLATAQEQVITEDSIIDCLDQGLIGEFNVMLVADQVPSDADQVSSDDDQVPSDDDTVQMTDLATGSSPPPDDNQDVFVGSEQFYLQQGLFMCASCRRQYPHRWSLKRHVRQGESDWIDLRNRLITFSELEEVDVAADWTVMSVYGTHWLRRFNEVHTSWYRAIDPFHLDTECEREWESLVLQNIITTSAISSRIRYMLSTMDQCGGNKCDRMNSCYYNQHGDIFVGIIRFVDR